MVSASGFTAWEGGCEVKNRLAANHLGKQTNE